MGRMGMTTPPRTLAEALRARDDESLAGLLRARPDLLSPGAERHHPARDPGRHPGLGRPRAGAPRPVRPADRGGAGRRAGPGAVRRRCSPCSPATARTTARPATTRVRRSGARLPAPSRRCANRPWSGARTTGCGWCAPRANCSPRPRSTRPPPAWARPSPRPRPGMSPGRLQEILAAAGLPATHDPVSAVASLTALFTDRARMARAARHRARRGPVACWTGWCGARRTAR